jgi:hypothetical protein
VRRIKAGAVKIKQRPSMKVLFHEPVRTAGAIAVLSAALLLFPLGYASAFAGGDHGGGVKDQLPNNPSSYGYYTSYSASEGPVTPCQSCYGGSGTDAQNLFSYNSGETNICKTCANGSMGR